MIFFHHIFQSFISKDMSCSWHVACTAILCSGVLWSAAKPQWQHNHLQPRVFFPQVHPVLLFFSHQQRDIFQRSPAWPSRPNTFFFLNAPTTLCFAPSSHTEPKSLTPDSAFSVGTPQQLRMLVLLMVPGLQRQSKEQKEISVPFPSKCGYQPDEIITTWARPETFAKFLAISCCQHLWSTKHHHKPTRIGALTLPQGGRGPQSKLTRKLQILKNQKVINPSRSSALPPHHPDLMCLISTRKAGMGGWLA